MNHYLQIASAVFAIIAAALWFASAFVPTPKNFSVRVSVLTGPSHLATSPVSDAYGESDELNALGKALVKQSHLSAAAASFAALAALSQAISVLLSSC
jgi:hypothetical protein